LYQARSQTLREEELDVTDDEPAFAAPPPDPELERLEPLLGTWSAEDHTVDGVFGSSVPVRSTETFRWLDGGYFLVQEYETTFGDEPTQKGVNYWFYDSESGSFLVIFFSNNGPFSEAGNRYSGRVAGGRLTLEGPARFQYDLDDNGMIREEQVGGMLVGGEVDHLLDATRGDAVDKYPLHVEGGVAMSGPAAVDVDYVVTLCGDHDWLGLEVRSG
jgi:hypothetical protein